MRPYFGINDYRLLGKCWSVKAQFEQKELEGVMNPQNSADGNKLAPRVGLEPTT